MRRIVGFRRLPSGRAGFSAAILVLSLGVLVSDAWALTPPISGAVALPGGADLRLPFPEGSRIRISSGYGPDAGSSLHRDTDRTDKANDHYALDLVYADYADGGHGMPVNAALPGTVIRAGWASEGWANYGLRVILRHDLGDGHVYHSLYAHLNAITVGEGDSVTQGEVLGELGRSCQGALSCGSFSGAHLHWALHQDSSIGGTGTGGSYGGHAVVPEPMGGAEDLRPGDSLTSTNGAETACGDGTCSSGEATSCPADCPTDAGVPLADAGAAADGGLTAADGGVTAADAGPAVGADAAIPPGRGAGTTDGLSGGCGCSAPRTRHGDGSLPSLLALAVVLLGLRARRRA